ncbi:MAG: DNA topoisomerase I [Candidatus Geothermincolia bacterium]
MKLIVTEKNQTARRIAEILSGGKAEHEGGPRSTVYAFKDGGDEVRTVGMRGHVLQVDFPEEYRQWQEVAPRELIDASIIKTPKDKMLVASLKKLAKLADSIVIATDYDREGELIGSDIVDLVREVNHDAPITRARFSALTPKEINDAFDNLDTLDENLARAGEARQDIDLIWGAALTRFISLAANRLWQKFLSAGRVQSPTLALVVDREADIRAFIPEDFWQVKVVLEHGGEQFTARHKTERFTDEAEARGAFENIGPEGRVTEVKTRERTMNPPAPFNTTTFLAAASNVKIPPARAMDVAESLYSRGFISYPRVDNTVYPESLDLVELLQAIQGSDVIGALAGELLQKKTLTPTRGKKFSTDHPPIYPTSAATQSQLSGLEWKVYELVARRFMATLSDQAKARSTRVDIDIAGEPFVARGDVIVSEGFLRYYPYSRKKDDELPLLEEGDTVTVVDKELEAKQTQPPARYTEGGLIQKMEELGLGTKSTRHNIIQSLVERGYVYGSPLKPSETGIAVSRALERHATMVTSPDMTSELEQDMDAIADGQQTLDLVVDRSREVLGKILDLMESQKEEIASEIKAGMRGDTVLGECPSCQGELTIKTARKSGKRFAGCATYPDCTRTYPLPQKGSILAMGENCEECGSPRIRVITKGRKPWELCLDPECPTKPKREPPPPKPAEGEESSGDKAE